MCVCVWGGGGGGGGGGGRGIGVRVPCLSSRVCTRMCANVSVCVDV